ncbi:hydrolase, NUDIX family [Gleimia coleocanis DSM 15436]|uniref:Hydrolase, NUDIX family n=1 Tax=Gleimia coleocanis DSM 15436 TaxID=525245 RepID=C0W1S1_9ACTO|nr:NUDIX domain-containing protein [Gleimia coleocanis]EEH63437.1 hydrolase, NUDIX family [Gleimia coleocanis DSM 15436]
MTEQSPIYVTALVFFDETGRILTVRKRGTRRFMLVGGKPEPGESFAEAGIREAGEEVGISLSEGDLSYLGTWEVPAANEPGRLVNGTVYTVIPKLTNLPKPNAEIAELRWLDVSQPLPGDLAPLLETRILPALENNS